MNVIKNGQQGKHYQSYVFIDLLKTEAELSFFKLPLLDISFFKDIGKRCMIFFFFVLLCFIYFCSVYVFSLQLFVVLNTKFCFTTTLCIIHYLMLPHCGSTCTQTNCMATKIHLPFLHGITKYFYRISFRQLFILNLFSYRAERVQILFVCAIVL